MLQMFYLDVAYVLQRFSCVLLFLQEFQTHVSNVSCLHTYVANVSSGCFKSRSGVTHVAMAPVAGRQQPAAGLQLLPHAFLGRRA